MVGKPKCDLSCSDAEKSLWNHSQMTEYELNISGF
jgi:hypothetical protein